MKRYLYIFLPLLLMTCVKCDYEDLGGGNHEHDFHIGKSIELERKEAAEEFRQEFADVLSLNVETVSADDQNAVESALPRLYKLDSNVRSLLTEEEKLLASLRMKLHVLVNNAVDFNVEGVTFNMVYVEGGTFMMGSRDGDSDEMNIHQVTLSSYYIGETEVTQELWQAVMGSNPSFFKGSNLPVEQVSWDDCQKFVKRLSALTGRNFRLPTEAQWEFAARGGIYSMGYQYSGSDNPKAVAWYSANSNNQTHLVATKQPNELGLYDMSGNVVEWCADWYNFYNTAAQSDPVGPARGASLVIRGGDWGCSSASSCRVASRGDSAPAYRYYSLGLRLVLVP